MHIARKTRPEATKPTKPGSTIFDIRQPASYYSCMQKVETQTVVAGAGIIGLTPALGLARTGQVVHVVERETAAGAAASGAAAGILAPRFNAEGPGPLFDLSMESWSLWPGLARDLRRLSGIDPRHRSDGLLHLAADRNEWQKFLKRTVWQDSA